jgi:hypothetical protein
MENQLRIRYRVDGVLHQTPLPAQLTRFQAAILSRIKVMANMDIAEKRLPQDGRIGMRIQGEPTSTSASPPCRPSTARASACACSCAARNSSASPARAVRERDEKIIAS